jgi:uncharacterized repeat protein (TIGR01451 family)
MMSLAWLKRIVTAGSFLLLPLVAHATLVSFSGTTNQTGGITQPVNTVGYTVGGVNVCPADPTPGCDFSTSDNIVRTHDIVEYSLNYNNSGTDTNVVATLAAPLGSVWDALPGFCGVGSSIRNNPAPTGGGNYGVTLVSTITCNLGTKTDQSESLPFRLRALGVPNGTPLAPTATIASTQTPALNLTFPTSIVTAAPRFDLRKIPGQTSPVFGPFTDINGNAINGVEVNYGLELLVPDGGRVGAAPLDAVALNLTDLLSALPAGAAISGCSLTAATTGTQPFPSYSVANATQSVLNSGTLACTQPGGPGTNANLTWSGVNTTLNIVPIQSVAGIALPAGLAYAAIANIRVVVPTASLPLNVVTQINNCVTGFDPNGGANSGVPLSNFFGNTEPGFSGTGNNCAIRNVANTARGSFSKVLGQDVYVPPGSDPVGTATGLWSGDGLVVPDSTFTAQMLFDNVGAVALSNVVFCDVFDNRKQRLTSIATGSNTGQYTVSLNATNTLNPIIEYNTGYATAGFPDAVSFPNSSAVANECAVTNGWVTDPTALPGGVAAATKVRVRLASVPVGATNIGVRVNFTALGTNPVTNVAWPNGTVIPDFAAWRADEANSGNFFANNYIPGAYPGTHQNFGQGDRAILSSILARINKVTLNAAGTIANDSVNSVVAGGSLGYALLPSLSGGAGASAPVVVHDVLPVGLTYLPATATVAGTVTEPLLSLCTGVNAPVPGCAVAGQQALTWNLGTQNANAALPEIRFRAAVSVSVTNGQALTNTTVIESPRDGSVQSDRTATRQVTVSVPAGLLIVKAVSPAQMEVNSSWAYTVTYRNTSATSIDTPDFIDILPAVGDGAGTWAGNPEGRSPATALAGTRTLQSVAASSPDGFTLFVTNTAISNLDKSPAAAANLNPGAGTSIWCRATITAGAVTVAGGQPAGCATTTAASLTAVRFQDNDTTYISSEGARTLTLNFTATGNAVGNTYTNDTGGFANAGIALPVISGDVTIPVVNSSISGRVYRDDNSDAVQGAEPGINGVTVTLCRVATNPCPAASTVATATTDANGAYQFPGLLSGTYYVFETQPAGYTDGPNNAAGTAGGTVAANAFNAITLPIGTNATGYNFGELGTPAIGTRKALNTAATPVTGSPGVFDVPYRIVTRNFGTTRLNNVSITDTVCGPGGTFVNTTNCAIQTAPVVTVTGTGTSAASAGAAYTGLAAGNNLIAAGAVLEVGGEITVDFTVRITLSSTLNFNNQANATGTPPGGGAPVSDLSNNGTSYTGGADTTPTGPNSNAPTPLTFAAPGVSGTVYADTNANGTRDGAGATQEPGIPGVTVTLCSVSTVPCPPASVVATTTTDTSGNYNFPSVVPGSYFVQETQPGTYGSSTANVVPITQTAAGSSSINFGETRGRIAGFVYNDVNGSGVREVGTDTGIAGVTVRLTGTDANGQPVNLSAVTQSDGSYVIDNIPVPQTGTTYTLTEDPAVPTGFTNGTTTVGTPTFAAGSTNTAPGTANQVPSTITGIQFTPPAAGTTARPIDGVNYNFGELSQGSVTGRVYVDTAANGLDDPANDPGVNGVTVTLCRVSTVPCPVGSVAGTTTTGADGGYTFNNVPAGNYFVQQTQPSQYGSSTPNILPITRSGNGNVTNVDFGETPARLGGRVYQDTNGNGTLDGSETGIPNVTVTLTGTDAGGNPVSLTATTGPDGTYTFTNVPAPNATGYTITEDQSTVPAVLANGTSNPGTITPNGGAAATRGTANNANSQITGITWTPPAAVATAPHAVGANYNFGEVQTAGISGTVVRDTDRNGTQNGGETGIAGVSLTLCRTNNVPCPASDVVAQTTTAADGTYTFPQVPSGSYFVVETQPPVYGDLPGASNTLPVTVSGTNVTNVNFYDVPAQLGGAVYSDANNNGTREQGEPGVPGIVVRLTGTDVAGNPVSQDVTTDANGNYLFTNLPAPNSNGYTIAEVGQPAQTSDRAANPGSLTTPAGGPVSGTDAGAAANPNTISGVRLPPGGTGTNYLFGDVPNNAGVSGTVWRDNDHDRALDQDEPVVPGWIVELRRTDPAGNNPTVVATTTTDAQGRYNFANLPPGSNYQIVFRSPDTRNSAGQQAIYGTPVNGEQNTPVAQDVAIANGIIQNITLVPGTIIPQQSLPLDPGGVVYDSTTRQPVAGAQVTIQGPPGFDPATHLVGGVQNVTQTTGASGQYQFLLLPNAPQGTYTLNVVPPAGYGFQSTVIPVTPGSFTPPNNAGGVATVAPQPGAPQASRGDPTTYYLSFNLTPGSSANVVNNHIPLDPATTPRLFISKVGDRSTAELGDSVRYTIRVRRVDTGTQALATVTVNDALPAGFRYINGTTTVGTATVGSVSAPRRAAPDPAGAPGPGLTFVVNDANLAPNTELMITYRVRLGVGSAQGTGINRARAAIGDRPNCAEQPQLCSNEAQFKVKVDEGVFTSDACVTGKIYVDCNNTHMQEPEEIGIPGVRLYFGDGTYVISDSEGKYSYCGLKPMTHVLKVDPLTLPKGSRLTTTSNRNAGDANSLFVDLKSGELHRADFAEGSCSNTVLEQVKARRSQGEVRSNESEKKGKGPLKFDGKAPGYPQQGTDSANQPLVKPREPAPKSGERGKPAEHENDTPVPALPASSPNTQLPAAGRQ